MNHRVISIVLFALSLATVGGVLAQRRQLTNLRLEHQHLLEQEQSLVQQTDRLDGPAPARTDSVTAGTSSELLQLRNQVSQLSRRHRELGSVRIENERLRGELSRRGTNSPSGQGLPHGYIRKGQAKMAGYNTPADTIQTFLWSLQNHDLPTLLQSFTPEAAQRMKAVSEEGGRSTEEFFREADALVGVGISGQQQLPDGSIQINAQVTPDMPPLPMRLQKNNGQWKLANPP